MVKRPLKQVSLITANLLVLITNMITYVTVTVLLVALYSYYMCSCCRLFLQATYFFPNPSSSSKSGGDGSFYLCRHGVTDSKSSIDALTLTATPLVATAPVSKSITLMLGGKFTGWFVLKNSLSA